MPTPVVRPDNLSIPFANSGEKNTIPVPSQVGTNPQLASLTTGFPPLTMTPVGSGGKPPYGQDMNGILYWLSQHTVFQNAGGQYRFDAALAADIGGYDIGTVLQNDDGTAAYVSAIDNNTGNFNTNPALIGTDWVPYSGEGVYLTATQLLNKIKTVDGAGSGLDADFLDGHSSDYFATAADLLASPTTDYTTGSGPGGKKNTFIQFPGGLTIQAFWGYAGVPGGSPVYYTNTFPTSFTTTCNWCIGVHFGTNASVNIVAASITGTTVDMYSDEGGTDPVTCMILAIGH